jgi:diguanylate cyclase (GGDEF)-like protein
MEDLQDELAVANAASPVTLVVLDLDGFKRYNDTFGHPAGDSLLARLGNSLKATIEPGGRAYRLGGDEFCALISGAGDDVEALVAATSLALADAGEGFVITASRGAVVVPIEAETAERAMQLADQRLYDQKAGRSRSVAGKQTRDALMQALQEREPGLKEHIDEVAALSRAVGRALDLSADDIDSLVRAAELHDIGKVAVPDSILLKPGPLDDTEWGFVRQHTVVGERILSAAPALVPVARIVRASHERWDGGGYPDGTSGEDIPLGARIVAICDAYHAITSERPYGEARPHEEAIHELRRCAGGQFDPDLVGVFCSVVEDFGAPAAPPPHEAMQVS